MFGLGINVLAIALVLNSLMIAPLWVVCRRLKLSPTIALIAGLPGGVLLSLLLIVVLSARQPKLR